MKNFKTYSNFIAGINERFKHNDMYAMLDIAAQYSSTQHQAANQMWSDEQDLYDYLKSDHIPKKYHKDFYNDVKRRFKGVKESVNEGKFNKKKLIKAMKKDDGMITVDRGKQYIIYKYDNGNDYNDDMWQDDVIFAIDQDGEEREIKYSDIESYSESVVTEGKFNKKKLIKAFKKDDAMISTGDGKEYLVYNPVDGYAGAEDMWQDDVVFALDQDGQEHEIKYSDIVRFDESISEDFDIGRQSTSERDRFMKYMFKNGEAKGNYKGDSVTISTNGAKKDPRKWTVEFTKTGKSMKFIDTIDKLIVNEAAPRMTSSKETETLLELRDRVANSSKGGGSRYSKEFNKAKTNALRAIEQMLTYTKIGI